MPPATDPFAPASFNWKHCQASVDYIDKINFEKHLTEKTGVASSENQQCLNANGCTPSGLYSLSSLQLFPASNSDLKR